MSVFGKLRRAKRIRTVRIVEPPCLAQGEAVDVSEPLTFEVPGTHRGWKDCEMCGGVGALEAITTGRGRFEATCIECMGSGRIALGCGGAAARSGHYGIVECINHEGRRIIVPSEEFTPL